ncbi:MAG: hypothetical protein HC869_02995 [Rhodospirillales bacterium]|nr:hypothetical protein [Rhodospirillales bacterium]
MFFLVMIMLGVLAAAAAHGARHGPINLGFYPTAYLGPEHHHHHQNQTEAISDYVKDHGGNLPTGRLQLVPVPDGIRGAYGAVHAIDTKFTVIIPFHLVFERRERRAAAQKVRFFFPAPQTTIRHTTQSW